MQNRGVPPLRRTGPGPRPGHGRPGRGLVRARAGPRPAGARDGPGPGRARPKCENSEILTFPGPGKIFSKPPRECSGVHGNAFSTTLDALLVRLMEILSPAALNILFMGRIPKSLTELSNASPGSVRSGAGPAGPWPGQNVKILKFSLSQGHGKSFPNRPGRAPECTETHFPRR